MEISSLSSYYHVSCLSEQNVDEIYRLCNNNTLYYEYCPPFVTREIILSDMYALPPGKDYNDKYYLGFYDREKLIAIMDLILHYPNQTTAFIGFLMTDVSVQNQGVGTRIIDDLSRSLKNLGFTHIRLGWMQKNPQAERFWHKNHFTETGEIYHSDDRTVVIACRIL